MKYFDRFPLVNYNGKVAKNLLSKVTLTDESKKDVYANFDYVLDEIVNRPDLLSEITYDSPHYDWTIYLNNGVIDPYLDYYRNQFEIQDYIESKYSTLDNSLKTILFYRNNWAEDTAQISVDKYDAMSANIQKYYEPLLNNYNQVIGYKRVEEDWIRSTNKIVELTVLDSNWIQDTGYVKQGDASANIVSVDRETNKILINHVSGEFLEGPFLSTEITNVHLITQNISDEEMKYWSPVNAYDMEMEDNELKRYIVLIRSTYMQDFDQNFANQIKK